MPETDPLLPKTTYVRPRTQTAKVTSEFKCCSCCLFAFLGLWVIGLLIWYYLVHLQIVFLNPPLINKSSITYYLKLTDAQAAAADIGTFSWWCYVTDFLLILPPYIIPVTFFLAENYNSNTLIIIMVIFLALLAIWELVKVFYFGWYWWFPTHCATYPFCVPRSGPNTSPADSTFVIEGAMTIAYFLSLAILCCLAPYIFNLGFQERKVLFASSNSRVSADEKTKPSHSFDLEDAKNSLIVGESVPDEEAGRRGKKSKIRQRITATSASSSADVGASETSKSLVPPPPPRLPGVLRQV